MTNKVTFAEFVMVWDHAQGLKMPFHHLKICNWLMNCWSKGHKELLLMAFRSSGKSTLVGLFCTWLLYQDETLRILVLAADFALAQKMVRNVKHMIERHPLCKNLIPEKREQWASDQFTIQRLVELRDPSMLAKGITSNITGSRADIVICDDVEVPNTCDSPTKRADLREKLHEISYVLVPNGTQLYVGTPHTYYSIYQNRAFDELGEETCFLDGFQRFELPILDKLGHSEWAERFDLKQIEKIRRRTGQNKFESQMMLRFVNIANARLEPDLMIPYGDELSYKEQNGSRYLYLDQKRMVSASCWWDPAYGAPDKGDRSVIALVFSDQDGHYWLHGLQYLTFSPEKEEEIDEASQLCQQVVTFLKRYDVTSLHIETNGIGKFLPGLLRRELKRSAFSCAVIEKTSTQNKITRILSAFDPVLSARSLHIHKDILNSPFVMEMREWSPSGNHKDDALDAVAGCLLNEPVRLHHLQTPFDHEIRRANWRTPSGQLRVKCDFTI